jgi:hypothetical protein
MDIRAYLALLPALLGLLVGVATVGVGLVAAAKRRQFGWLLGFIGIIVAWVLAVTAAPAVALSMIPRVCNTPEWNASQCQQLTAPLLVVFSALVTIPEHCFIGIRYQISSSI